MAAVETPPISRQPLGATFVVAAIVLGLFGLGQILAVVVYFLPEWRKEPSLAGGAGRAERERMPGGAESQESGKGQGDTVAAEPGSGQASQAATDPAVMAKVLPLVGEADRLYRIGEFDGALGLLRQAESLLPMNPQIQFRLGLIFEEMGQNAEAYLAFERSLQADGLSAEVRRQAEQKLMLLSQVMGGRQGQVGQRMGGGSGGLSGGEGGVSVREPSGLQPGANLGIIDCRMVQGQDGSRRVRVAIKSRDGVSVDSQAAEVKMTFYVKDELGEVEPALGDAPRRWISEPVDWRDGEPEVVDFDFRSQGGGGEDAGIGDVGEKVFAGYVVAIYYQGELQDAFSEPPDLQGKFAPALILND